MSVVSGKFTLPSDIELQFRRTQTIDDRVAAAIQGICETNPQIAACYLLDARHPKAEKIVLVIAVAVDDEATQMDSVVSQFKNMLHRFPAQASKTFIMSAASFTDKYSGTEFYSRSTHASHPMNVIRTYSHLQKAHFAKALLEAHEIPVELMDEMTFQMDMSGGMAAGGIRLAVPDEHREKALDLLGRETDEAKKRVQEYDRQLKVSIVRFVLIVAVFSLVLLASKGFRSDMIGPSIMVSIMLAAMTVIARRLLAKSKTPK